MSIIGFYEPVVIIKLASTYNYGFPKDATKINNPLIYM